MKLHFREAFMHRAGLGLVIQYLDVENRGRQSVKLEGLVYVRKITGNSYGQPNRGPYVLHCPASNSRFCEIEPGDHSMFVLAEQYLDNIQENRYGFGLLTTFCNPDNKGIGHGSYFLNDLSGVFELEIHIKNVRSWPWLRWWNMIQIQTKVEAQALHDFRIQRENTTVFNTDPDRYDHHHD